MAVFAVAAFAAYKYFVKSGGTPLADTDGDAPLLAMYHRDGSPAGSNDPKNYLHLNLRITATGSEDVLAMLSKVWKAGAPVLLTVETWPGVAGAVNNENVLTQVTKGVFDNKIKSLASFIAKQSQPVLLRFNPDMEVYVDVFPWQMQSPDLYASAFNHVAALIKQNAPDVKMVWSPAGYPGAEEYWPGNKWVDLVSVTLKGKSELQTSNYPKEKNQQELLYRKLHRMRFFDKAVLVIGSEVLGKKQFEQSAFDAAVQYIRQNADVEYIDLNAPDKSKAPELLRTNGNLITGVFDPFHLLVDSVNITTEHLFVNIPTLKRGLFKRRFDSVMKRNRSVIVTMEPWKDKKLTKDPALIQNILQGKYDSLFEQMYAVIGSANATVYLRWLHEMEIPIKRYPWQSQDPIQYIKAYRYFVNFVRSKNPQHIYFVWGPAGDRGSMEFWPGSDVVDYTSIAIYGLPDKNITDHNKQESFNTIFRRKYRRIAFSHKPLLITEFGVKGPADFKAKWLADAAAVIESNKEITGISYFNDADSPKAWGDIEAPDWSVSPALYNGFLRQLVTAAKK